MKTVVRALAACGALAAAALLGYENDGRAKAARGGPHRAINRLALERFFEEKARDPIVSRYDLSRRRTLTDETYVAGGLFRPEKGDRSATFARWIEEGGYTADEPELYASFRHFFDPLALNPETPGPAGTGTGGEPPGSGGATGIPYLTDDLNSLNAVYSRVTGTSVNPRIHAMEWAIDGPENNGWGENPYCWRKGVDYVEQAFPATGPEKSRLWAKAWRSLGETMHLLADMTSVPHVRNDSHPSASSAIGEDSDHVGRLRSDPYETLTQEPLVLSTAGGAPPPVPLGRTPEEIFDAVARFTNGAFFSADTISGVDPVSGRAVTNANGMLPYPSPRLEECRDEGGYLVKEVAGRSVRMAHRSWLATSGWGETMHFVRLSSACVRDQASVLVPLAIAANAQLVDLFLPRVRVEVTDVDLSAKRLRGRVVHVPWGPHAKELKYSAGPGELSTIFLDDGLQRFDDYSVEVRDGIVEADLSRLDLRKDARLRLDVPVGGIVVRSPDFVLGDDLLARLQRTKSVTIRLVASGDERVVSTDARSARSEGVRSGSYKGASLDSAILSGPAGERRTVPLVWSGPSFVAEARLEGNVRCLRCPRDGTGHASTVFVSVSGTVDLASRTLATLHASWGRRSSYPSDCGEGRAARELGITESYLEDELSLAGLPLVPPSPGTAGTGASFGVDGLATRSHVATARRTSASYTEPFVGHPVSGTQRSELVGLGWESAAVRPSLSVSFQP